MESNNLIFRNTDKNWLYELLNNKIIIPKKFISFSYKKNSGGADNFGETCIVFNHDLLLEQNIIEIIYDEEFFEDNPEICEYVTGFSTKDEYYQQNDYLNEEDFNEKNLIELDCNTLNWETYLDDFSTESELVMKKLIFKPGIILGVKFKEDKPTKELIQLLKKNNIIYL